MECWKSPAICDLATRCANSWCLVHNDTCVLICQSMIIINTMTRIQNSFCLFIRTFGHNFLWMDLNNLLMKCYLLAFGHVFLSRHSPYIRCILNSQYPAYKYNIQARKKQRKLMISLKTRFGSHLNHWVFINAMTIEFTSALRWFLWYVLITLTYGI